MSEKATLVEQTEAAETPTCRHHWVIESPNGAVSAGVCKYCGTRKEFFNSTPETLWDSGVGIDLSSGRWGRERGVDTERELSLSS